MLAGAISGATPVTQSANANRFAEIQTDDFIKVLVSEMANQDPFEPQDSAALLEQLSSLRNIESQLVLQGKLEELILQNQVTNASGLIGRHVSGMDVDNNVISGIVTSVLVQNGKAVLELDSGGALSIDRVNRIDVVDLPPLLHEPDVEVELQG